MSPIPVGELRPSQLLFTFGVGSLVDLPSMSVIVMGLDEWNQAQCTEIPEDRLLAAVRRRLGHQLRRLLMPPVNQDDSFPFADLSGVGVPVVPFPRWYRCPRCDLLAPLSSGLFKLEENQFRPDRTRYFHDTCPKAIKPMALPVRFLLTCRNGHLDEFPWLEFVHKGGQCPHPPPILRLREFGAAGEASDIEVRCVSCNAARRLGDAFGEQGAKQLPVCRARHPHLRQFADGDCNEQVKVTLLGASNTWFPVNLSVLHIPGSADELDLLVEDYWATLSKVTSREILQYARNVGQLPGLAGRSDDDIWLAIQRRLARTDRDDQDASADLKLPEWERLSEADVSKNTYDFQLRAVSPPPGFESVVEKTVLVERLREVRALLGFTRVESPGDFLDPGDLPDVRRAPLSRSAPPWIPASEVRGEGVFIQLREDAVAAWCSSDAVKRFEDEFRDAHKAWRSARRIEPAAAGFLGVRYVLLHSLAHALLRQFTLECGYTTASIRERIYSRPPTERDGPMAGVLIYTAAPDSEGTLGGLVSLGGPDRLAGHLEQALEQVRICAADPLCSEHSPLEETTVNGAACHACLFAPETSCERGNRYLDRSVLVETYTASDRAYFGRGK